jgi:Tfp pilus assembly pilus retraction ATPase PilT
MKTMNQSLAELYSGRKISVQDAMAFSSNPQELSEMLAQEKSLAYS